MRKIILSLLSLIVGFSAMAQTTYYAAISESKSKVGEGKGVIYGFDPANPQTITEIAFTDEEFTYEIKHGVLAEDIYFAVVQASEPQLVSFNCTTNTKTVVGAFNYEFSFTETSRANILGMTYDSNTKKLYVLVDVNFYDEAAGTSESYYGIFECNQSNAKLKEVSRYYDNKDSSKSTNYSFAPAFCADGNGGIYAISITYSGGYVKKLYNININSGKVTEVGEFAKGEMSTGIMSHASLALDPDGMLIYSAGQTLSKINPADCSISYFTNSLKQLPGLSTGLCFAKSSADPVVTDPGEDDEPVEVNDTYKVKVEETWGDILGMDSGCTYKTFSYYNADNKLARTAGYGKLVGEDGAPVADDQATYQLERYTQYNYNELGQLEESWTEQYGIFDGEDLAYNESYDRTKYYYDENGRLILKDCIGENCQWEYKYDEEGNLIYEARLQLDAYDRDGDGDKTDYYVLSSVTYSDFVNGNPTKGLGDGMFSNYQFNAVYTYDEEGRKIEEVQSNYSDTNTNRYVWTYNGDLLVKYEEFKWKSSKTTDEDGNTVTVYDWKGTKYTEYIPEANNTDRVKRIDWTWDEWIETPTWTTGSVYTVTEYADFDGVYAPQLTIAPVEDSINTAKLIITPPAAAMTQQLAFDIYRKGIVLGRVLSTDMNSYDAETGSYFFIDEDVVNGEYDYWVQTIIFDEIGETESSKNVAVVQKHTFNVELPAVTEFEVVEVIPYESEYVDPYEGTVTPYTGNYGRIEWKAPADAETMEKLGFVRYNVYQKNMKAADNNLADGQALTWDFDFYEKTSYDIYIQTVYKYGKSDSEIKTLTINIEPKENTYQLACAQTDWNMDIFTKVEGEENKYELKYDEFTGEFKLYVNRDLYNCYTMGAYNPDIDENPFVIGEDNLLVGPDSENPAMVIDKPYKDVTFTLTVEGEKLYLKMAGTDTGIDAVNAENGLYNVYNYQGIRILSNVEKAEVNALPAGFYIVNGKKVVIK